MAKLGGDGPAPRGLPVCKRRMLAAGELIAMVISIQTRRQTDLTHVAYALRGVGGCFGLAQRGQQHCGQDRYDGNDDQEFNQCKCKARSRHT